MTCCLWPTSKVLNCRSNEQTSEVHDTGVLGHEGKGDGESEGTDLSINGATGRGGGRM